MHSFTLLLVYNVQWPVGNCQASIAYPHVLLKPNLSSITNYPPDAHMGGLHSPKHPSLEGDAPTFGQQNTFGLLVLYLKSTMLLQIALLFNWYLKIQDPNKAIISELFMFYDAYTMQHAYTMQEHACSTT
jgi:hypothetical protein